MRRTQMARLIAHTWVLSILLAACMVSGASAGEFTLASCQADRANFSSTAFNDFATRGMKIRRACNPEGPGIRGLVTANATGQQAVPRGSIAMVAISAPPGTRFTSFRWAGSARRVDCRYSLQLYAEGPDIKTIPIKNVRANQECPGRSPGLTVQAAGYRSRTFNVNGATRIVQRVVCAGGDGRKSCSARSVNYIRTYKAEVGVADEQAPTATIAGDTPLAAGAWVGGNQPLNYSAEDNVGVRLAQAVAGERIGGFEQRPCSMARSDGAYASGVPCPNGAGHIAVQTSELLEGTQELVVRAQDAAGNVGPSAPVTARIDNTPPSRVDVAVDGGEQWRNRNDFAVAWTNPAESDRAPIAGVGYKLCPAAGGDCNQGEQAGDAIARLPIQAPAAGEWSVSLWRRDAAGNADQATASVPVQLRYDPEPPQVGFDALSASDPTLVTAQVTDKVSGLAEGAIEISPIGSGTWQALDTQKDGGRLVARIDDSSLPAGSYSLRASARDQARNEASTTQRLDGQAMTVTLPLRIGSAMRAGLVRYRVEKRVVRRNGKRRTVRRRLTVLKPSGRVSLGRRTRIAGQLTNRDGQGVAGAEVQVLATAMGAPEQLVGVLRTDAAGDYTYIATGSTSRTLRFVYGGSPLILPVQTAVKLIVPAVSSLSVNRRRALNGQTVKFSGRVQSVPIPAGGKLIQMEVLLSRRWQTFRTVRTDPSGRWVLPYRFARTRGAQSYRFRAKLPSEAGYPFAAGTSKSVKVRVRGRS